MTQRARSIGLGSRRRFWVASAVAVMALAVPGTQAHKGITSKFTYNDHVFPIFRDRCGRCHVDGGPTPMSLVTYKDAVPWAESIREQLLSEAMPPWYADPMGPATKGGHVINAKEINMLVTWATGGTPMGDPAKTPAPITAPATWRAGPPDHVLRLTSPHTLPPGTSEDRTDFTLSVGLSEEKWVKAVDLLPESPSMVRDAVIAIDNGPVLALWVPGDDLTPAPSGTAFRLPPGSKLRVQIHYKKHWQDEQQEKTDRSSIGLYFTDPPVSGRALEALALSASTAPSDPLAPRAVTGQLASAARVVSLRPMLDRAYADITVEAVLPAGRRVVLLRLHAPRPQWRRRYWLAEPVELPKGTSIEMKATPALLDESTGPTGQELLQVALDFVAL